MAVDEIRFSAKQTYYLLFRATAHRAFADTDAPRGYLIEA